MTAHRRSPRVAGILAFWNWKCALLSATARSLVYLTAMIRSGARGELAVVLIEVAYVLLTSGFYAGMQQRALNFRSKLLGNAVVVLGVPALAQMLDWFAHRAAGAPAPGKATIAVCIFAAVSALFHLHVMRHGVFLSGCGRTLVHDFRRMPRLVAGFVVRPFAIVSSAAVRITRAVQSETA